MLFHKSSLAVLTCGDERLIILINSSNARREVALRLRDVAEGLVLAEYESKITHDPTAPVQLSVEPGEVKVLHLRGQ